MEIHVLCHPEARFKALKWAKMKFRWKNRKARPILLPYWKAIPFPAGSDEMGKLPNEFRKGRKSKLWMFVFIKVWMRHRSNSGSLFSESDLLESEEK